MRATCFALLAMLMISAALSVKVEDKTTYSSDKDLAEMEAVRSKLAQKIGKLEAEIKRHGTTTHAAQRVALAQSEGLLDTLKILFLNLALKIVEAVS